MPSLSKEKKEKKKKLPHGSDKYVVWPANMQKASQGTTTVLQLQTTRISSTNQVKRTLK